MKRMQLGGWSWSRAGIIGALLTVLIARSARAETADAGSSGPERGALTLDETVRSALTAHPAIASARQELPLAQADVLSARGGFDPSVRARAAVVPYGPYPNERVDVIVEQPTPLYGARLFGGYRLGAGSFATYDGKLETADYGEFRGGVGVPLWRDGPIDRRRAAVSRAEAGIDGARATIEQQRVEIARAAALRYWEWVAAGRRLAIAKEILAIAVARDAGLRARVARGDLPDIERAENTRVIHQRDVAVASAERALENASLELSLFLRDSRGRPLAPDASRLPPALPRPTVADAPLESSLRRAMAQRPEPRRLDALAQQARIDRDLADNQRKPGIDLSFAVARDVGPSNDPKLQRTELEAMVLLDIPILTRVQDGRVDAAEAQLARVRAQAQLARDRIATDVRDAASAMALARARAASAASEVTVSRELVTLERQRFELGDGTLLIVNLREQALAEAELREVDALVEAQRALVNHRAALGEP